MLINLRVYKGDKGRTGQEIFCSHFQAGILLQISDTTNGEEEIQLLVTCKKCYAITNVKHKAIQDYYLNHKDSKLAQKVIGT